jgi:hypothetical protein
MNVTMHVIQFGYRKDWQDQARVTQFPPYKKGSCKAETHKLYGVLSSTAAINRGVDNVVIKNSTSDAIRTVLKPVLGP